MPILARLQEPQQIFAADTSVFQDARHQATFQVTAVNRHGDDDRPVRMHEMVEAALGAVKSPASLFKNTDELA